MTQSPPGRIGPPLSGHSLPYPRRGFTSTRDPIEVFAHPDQLSHHAARVLRGAVARGPPVRLKELKRLVTERIDAGADGQRVGDVDVQALDAARHAARGDLVAERLDGVPLGEVRLVRALVLRGE